MSSPAPVWPISLPQALLVAGLSYQPVSNATAIPVEAGELLTRQRFTGKMVRLSGSLLLTTAQAETLISFWRDDLGETEPFEWTDPLTGETIELVFETPNGAPRLTALSTDQWQAALTLVSKPVAP